MSKRRDVVALSAILTAPLAILLAQHFAGSTDVTAEVMPSPAPVVAAPLPAPPAPAPEPPAPPTPPAPAPVAAPEPPPAAPVEPTRDPGQFMFMHGDALVLHTRPDLAWSSGKISTSAQPGHFIASRRTAPDKLPEPLRALAGATVTVYAADGSACVATVGPIRVQIEQTGDVYEVSEEQIGDDGEGPNPYDPPTDPAVLKRMAKQTFADAAATDALLLARQRNQAGRACTGLWARRADLPAPAVFGRRALADDEQKRVTDDALALIRGLPEFAEVRDAYAARLADYGPEYAAEAPTWDEFVAANLRADRWDEVGGPRKLVHVELRERPEGCGDWFDPGIALVLEQTDQGLAVRQPGWYDLAALTDLDRDGTFEGLVTGEFDYHRLDATGPNAPAVRDEFSIPFNGCPC